MSTLISSPFPVFTDTDGLPLEGGYIDIGVAGLNPISNPIQVYFDEALTIPASNIRTTKGYPARNGSAAFLYAPPGDFSILVRNKNNVVIFSNLNVIDNITVIQNDIFLIENDITTIENKIGITGGTGIFTGNGVAFPAAQVASADPNTLDDYEEGTWTIIPRGGTTAGTYQCTLDTGYYTKIGDTVHAWGLIETAAVVTGGGSGDFRLNLPFVARSPGPFAGNVAIQSSIDWTVATGSLSLIRAITGASDLARISVSTHNATRTIIPITSLVASKVLWFSVSYGV
jgi:hypothetical protein